MADLADHDCAQIGHHFHEADGAIFSRVRTTQTVRNGVVVAVHCCWCEAATEKTGYGERKPAGQPNAILCGPHVTAREA